MEVDSTEKSFVSDYRNFKPMFTLQPVKATREKQLKQWSSIIMKHCKDDNLNQINPSDFSLFSNHSIDRQLSDEGITAVVENMIKSGKSAHTRLSTENIFALFLPYDFRAASYISAICNFNSHQSFHSNIRERRVGKWSSRQNTTHHTKSSSSFGK